jgi:predicted GTPase
VELAARDIGALAKTYLPGGHLLTIDHLRQARQAAGWYKNASNAFWAVSAVIDPIRTGIRYAAAQAGLAKPLQKLQENAFLWLYANFIRRLGHYFIELYSGRLKIGVERYRELLEEHATSESAASGDTILVDADRSAAAGARAVRIAVVGQVKAGKSSLINALLGQRRAVTDVIPSTSGVSNYELRAPANPSKLILLDTVGYNQAGPAADEFETTVGAAQEADLILLVTQAVNPARQADVQIWRQLREWFAERPHLKMPSALLVMTHIDLLSPVLEWSPPYDWRHPKGLKEQNIAEAAALALEQFGEGIIAVVPVCTASGKIIGVHEELMLELVQLLGNARAVAFLRCLHAEADERMVQKVFDQLYAAGKVLLFDVLKH